MKKPAIPDDYPTDNVLFEEDDDDQTETEDTKQSDKLQIVLVTIPERQNLKLRHL